MIIKINKRLGCLRWTADNNSNYYGNGRYENSRRLPFIYRVQVRNESHAKFVASLFVRCLHTKLYMVQQRVESSSAEAGTSMNSHLREPGDSPAARGRFGHICSRSRSFLRGSKETLIKHSHQLMTQANTRASIGQKQETYTVAPRWLHAWLQYLQWTYTTDTAVLHKATKDIDGLVQDCNISSVLAMQILQSCMNHKIYTVG